MSDVIDTEKLNALFQEQVKEAEAMLASPEKVLAVIDEVDEKLRKDEVLRNAVEGICELSSFLRSAVTGEFTEASHASVAAVLGSFLYLNKTEDAIHDASPVIGYIDDLGIIATALDIARADFDRYLAWKTC